MISHAKLMLFKTPTPGCSEFYPESCSNPAILYGITGTLQETHDKRKFLIFGQLWKSNHFNL